MSNYDLCLTWNWEYDANFVQLLDLACRSRGLSLLQITPENLFSLMPSIVNREITFQIFFDRASDGDARFIPMVQWACNHAVHHINFHESACHARDKVAMHQAISVSMNTPLTLILPSHEEQPRLPAIDLSLLGEPFTIKPARGGGGEGVINEATTLSQVLMARQTFPNQNYLLQSRIIPDRMDSRMAWFRVIHVAGNVYPCWWDTCTHIYSRVTPLEEIRYNLGSLRSLSSSVATICGLELFSTEIAMTPDDRFVIVDYVNDPIDLRLQSTTPDGVPDDVVKDITERLADLALTHHLPSRRQSFQPSMTV